MSWSSTGKHAPLDHKVMFTIPGKRETSCHICYNLALSFRNYSDDEYEHNDEYEDDDYHDNDDGDLLLNKRNDYDRA